MPTYVCDWLERCKLNPLHAPIWCWVRTFQTGPNAIRATGTIKLYDRPARYLTSGTSVMLRPRVLGGNKSSNTGCCVIEKNGALIVEIPLMSITP